MSLVAIGFFVTPVAQHIENRFGLDLLFSLRQPIDAPPGVLIAALDRQSLAWLRSKASEPDDLIARGDGCFPVKSLESLRDVRSPSSVPRPLYACLLNELRQLGFPVVAFDILFSVPGRPDEDRILAEALNAHGSTAILVGFERYSAGTTGADLIVDRQVEPHSLFRQNAAATGLFVLPRTRGSAYGYWRRVEGFSGVPSLIDQALRLKSDLKGIERTEQRYGSQFSYFWLYGAPGTIPTISISDILNGDRKAELRRLAPHTTVFVGASDPSTANFPDSHSTVYPGKTGANISGVELAATAFLNRQAGHHLRRFPWLVEMLLLLAVTSAMAFAALSTIRHSIVAIPVLAVGFLIGSFVAFSQFRLFVPIVTPVYIAAPVIFLIAIMIRANIARALIMQLAPAPIARRMLDRARDPMLEFVSNHATVVFFDIIGSTKIGEGLPELKFSALINDYHDLVTKAVEGHGGFVVAFAGDGATAVFDRSNAGSDHALLACRAVVAAMNDVGGLNRTNAANGLPPLESRVGINSGIVAEGGIGGRDRFNFSVAGDAVNLAARLEQLGKTLFPDDKNVILVGATTRKLAAQPELEFVDYRVVEEELSDHRLVVAELRWRDPT